MATSPFADAYASYPARLGVVRWSATRVTIVAKLTFDVLDDGGLRPARWEDQDPIGLDRLAPGGDLAWPSDFAPYKPACDVIVGSDDQGCRGGAGSLEVGDLRRALVAGESLAPREVFAPDPTAPEAFEAWTSGAVAATRFQCAPPDRRTALLAPPFALALARDGVTVAARFAGPWPSITLVDRAGNHLGRVSLPIDLVGLAPARRKVTLVGRAVLDATAAPFEETVLVVQLGERDATAGPWHTPSFVTPRDAAARAARSAPSLATSRGAATAVADHRPPPEAPVVEGTAIARAGVDLASAMLPFRAPSSGEVSGRAAGTAMVDRSIPAGTWDDTGTRAAPLDVARAMPFRSAQAAPLRRDAPLGAPQLRLEELVARVVALDEEPVAARATLGVDLERWAERLDDPSPGGPLAALLAG